MKLMVVMLTVLLVAALSHSQNPQSLTPTIQPGCAYWCIDKEYSDSIFIPEYANTNKIRSCKGFKALDTGVIYVQPTYNSTVTRYRIHITDEKLDEPINEMIFKWIWERGTTIPLDSIWVYPDIGN